MSEKLIGACIFGQSGGPTSVINASAYGVIRTALDAEEITNPFGILRVIFVPLYCFHPFGVSNHNTDAALFENVKHGNPILPGGLHADIQTRILMQPIGKAVQIRIEG